MIPVLNRILFATDLSETAKITFGFAVALADKVGGELLIVHIIKKEAHFSNEIVKIGLGEGLYNEMEQRKTQSARNVLIGKRTDAVIIREKIHQLFSEVENGLNHSKPLQVKDMVIESDSISEGILRLSRTEACDMIVMGHRSRRSLADAMGESTVKKVLQQATIPVVLVPAFKDKNV